MTGLKDLMLGPPRLWLAAAESMTCGGIQARVGAISGASTFFRGGATAYDLDRKVSLLRVDRAAAKAVNCVSAEVAEQMAAGACALFDADLGIATTGYAEPSAGENVAAPFAWWALAWRRDGALQYRRGRVDCPGASRTAAQAQVADAALAALVDWLKAERTRGPASG